MRIIETSASVFRHFFHQLVEFLTPLVTKIVQGFLQPRPTTTNGSLRITLYTMFDVWIFRLANSEESRTKKNAKFEPRDQASCLIACDIPRIPSHPASSIPSVGFAWAEAVTKDYMRRLQCTKATRSNHLCYILSYFDLFCVSLIIFVYFLCCVATRLAKMPLPCWRHRWHLVLSTLWVPKEPTTRSEDSLQDAGSSSYPFKMHCNVFFSFSKCSSPCTLFMLISN